MAGNEISRNEGIANGAAGFASDVSIFQHQRRIGSWQVDIRIKETFQKKEKVQ